MDAITQTILAWDLQNLTTEQVDILHDLKQKSLGRWAAMELERLRRADMGLGEVL